MNGDPTILWIGRLDLGLMAIGLIFAAVRIYEETCPPLHWTELPQSVGDLRLRHVLPVVGFAAAALVLLSFGMCLFAK
ncbi:MAG: hypothetical protein KGJ57_17615 [Sphingomonadales bacterium]|nr:hypothetical protein [Sphingomonadales bacterium]MDE2171217.1 hypothetical protein [Sphingomonadales bacterium]